MIAIIFALTILSAFLPTTATSQPPALTAVRDLHIAPETAGLSLVVNMAVSADGIIVVTQPEDYAIRFFSPAGRSLGSVGRSGAGPGEFRYVAYLLWTGDTLWVSDPRLKRITLISTDRKVLSTALLPPSALYHPGGGKQPLTFSSLHPRARYPGGTMLFDTSEWDRKRMDWLPPSYRAGEYPLLLVRPNGQVSKVIGFTPSSFGCEEGAITIPFCAAPLEAYAADGSRIAFATVQGSSGGKGTYRVVALNQRGDTLFDRTYPYVAVSIPRSAIDSARNRRVSRALRPESRADAERMRIPTVYPPIRNLIVGRDGTVWVEMRAVAGERRWQILAPDGKPVGEVALPPNVTVKVAQRDRIWAAIENEDGEQGIASYAIRGGR